ncbi:hypothetical protein [Mucilaginibacter sp.]|uniref:hypothetical protein n=1 Tax=Mucilaginibacter sp. TaxID=1882438 RepID=UPI002638D05F|nr:hypothetical protein [Mucilaginibacter sp.]MDB4918047.1 hypothetical protein [Mucilaginibacter sp.]
MQKAIAVEDIPFFGQNRGLVSPLFIYEDGDWRKVTNPYTDFPNNGKIFVLANYSFIEQQYQKKPFIIEFSATERDADTDSSSKFIAQGTNTDLPLLELCRIYNKEKIKYNAEGLITLLIKEVPNNSVFIRHENELLGPFKTHEYDEGDDGYFTVFLKSVTEIGDGIIYKIKLEDTENQLFEFEGNSYVLNASSLIDNAPSKEEIWYISKKEILSWAKIQFGKNIDSSLLDFLKAFVNVNENDIRIQKLKELSTDVIQWLPIRDKIIYDFFANTDSGKSVIETFLAGNRNKILSDNEIQTEAINIVSEKTVENYLDSKLAQLNDEQRSFIEGLLDQPENLVTYVTISNLVREEIKLETRIESKQTQLDGISEQVTNKYNELEQFENAYRSLKVELQSESTIKKNLLNIKTYTDILNGIDLSSEDLNSDSKKILPVVLPYYEKLPNLKDYIQDIVNKLENRGRKISFNDVFNYLILIQQNFLTVFAGYPGTGKTSLIRELSQLSGIDPFFSPISVARGWTSIKDFIGYWNPLTQRFQAANNSLYKNLQDHNLETYSNYPFWTMLDEANLSPMEHYWSDFMMLSDLQDNERFLSVRDTNSQNAKNLPLGKGFRFLTTINFDHTTEVLSPRLKDRAAIVMIDIPEFKNIDLENHARVLPTNVLSYQQAKDLFDGKTAIRLTQDESSRLEDIIDILKDNATDRGMPIIISPRKIKAITKYCETARDIMGKEGGESPFTALDFAVCQFILPVVEGRSEPFKKRLESLSKALTLLPKSTERLRKMIEFGQVNNHNYRFFC